MIPGMRAKGLAHDPSQNMKVSDNVRDYHKTKGSPKIIKAPGNASWEILNISHIANYTLESKLRCVGAQAVGLEVKMQLPTPISGTASGLEECGSPGPNLVGKTKVSNKARQNR